MTQLTIAIVGHTNTGKTSLVRALAQERNFGDVRDAPSTTIDVTTLSLSSRAITLNFIDTPGIEDAIGILEILETQEKIHSKKDELNRLIHFINTPEIQETFEQEVKIIKQLLACDITFYVIDTRIPYLPKFDYEIQLILQAHKPVLPILNFLKEGTYINEWKSHLKAYGLHQFLEYDTIILPKKKRLYEQIAIMFPDHYQALQNFIHEIEEKEQQQESEAYRILSNYYINLTTLQIKQDTSSSEEIITKELTNHVDLIEKKAIHELIQLYRFNEEDITHLALPLTKTKLTQDFFTSDNFIDFSMQFGKGAATGAGLFAGIDMLTAFTTLGAATATGALIGGVTNTLKHYSTQLVDYWRDLEIFCLNDAVLLDLTARMYGLIDLINGRSHAETKPLEINHSAPQKIIFKELLEKTTYLRAYPNYCEVTHPNNTSKSRKKAEKRIQEFFLTKNLIST